MLAARGLLLVGLDVIGDCLTEINVTSPTCFQEITQQTGFDVPAMFIDALEAAGRSGPDGDLQAVGAAYGVRRPRTPSARPAANCVHFSFVGQRRRDDHGHAGPCGVVLRAKSMLRSSSASCACANGCLRST